MNPYTELPGSARACLILLLCMGLALSRAGADERLPAGSVSLQRATLTVADLERSIAFYRDLLGFTLRSRSAYDTPALRRMFAIPPGVSPELALLDSSEQQPRSLALLSAQGIQTDPRANRSVAPALLFQTKLIDEIHLAMVAADVEILLPPTPLNDFAGKPFGREAAYLDPDGVRVILFEYD
jgi:catechol 2,3-dioxygenase-like lactoylglutathione lyase family enzyme